jgi:putative peptidoglycan lipid II flippase
MAADMLRITFPYLFFISLTAFASATLNAYQLFWAPAFAPVLLNLSLISCAIWLAPQLSVPVYALAWGVFFAGIAQLCFQLPFLFKRGLLPKPYWGWNDSGVQKILKLMLPVLFGVGVSQINLLLDTIIASFLRTGSIAWLYYSDRLLEFPLGVLAIALGTVILPNLSKQHASRNPQEFSATLDWGVRSVILVGLPAALSLFLLAFPMLTTFFQYRQFSLFDATMASHSLQAFALGLVAMMLIKILAPAYFARQDTKRPVRYGVMAMITNMVLNLILVFGFDLGHVGLALATSLSAWLNAGLLFIGLWRDRVFQPGPGWLLLLVRLLVALGLLTTFLLISLDYWHQWATWSWSVRVSRLLAICLAGSVLYLLSLWLLGMRVNQFKPASHYYQAYLKKEVSP